MTQLSVLSPAQLDLYDRCGFVEVRQAFSPDLAVSLANEVWDELRRDQGIDRDDPATWRQPHRAPRRAKKSTLNEHLAGDRFRGAISDVRGSSDWRMPTDWGGFLVTFPDSSVAWDVPTDTWHWDSDGTAPGPFIFSFYSDVGPQGGGTLILSGSPRLLAEFCASLSETERQLPHKVHRRMFSEWDPWLAALMGRTGDAGSGRVARFMEQATEIRGIEVRVVELCGSPGDAVFCSPLILHAIAPNVSGCPRLMRSKFFYS